MPEKLKLCPFCGNPAELVNEYGKWIVKCSSEADCQGQVDISPSGLNGWESAELAVDGWNERSHEPRRTDASQGMDDCELLTRAIVNGFATIVAMMGAMNGQDMMQHLGDGPERFAKEVAAELDRRAAARKESK